jgi:hypothetical protein
VTFDYANFQFHIFSYNRLLAKDMFYDGATLSTVTCGTWCDTVDVMYDTLDVGPVQPPVETSDLEERVKALELLVSKLVAWKENSL